VEHERLLALGDVLYAALRDGVDAPEAFAEFVRLLQMHAAREEVGLFVQAKASTPMGGQIDELCLEHEDLRRWLADGLHGRHVPEALRLLVTHIDDEEYDLFPHIFHALDPEQWDEIELAHRAIDVVWGEPDSDEPSRQVGQVQ
jgi:hemerythrin-like domain-containing protein